AAVAIALRLSEALSYAHAEGVLHRDVKPANILIDRDGATLLTDFGLCKVDGDASLTRDTDIVGTLRYMPPESIGGQSDGRGDVYGVGLVLLEILAGEPAFDPSDRKGLIAEILHEDPVPLREKSVELSSDLEKVVRKAVAKLPEERYATAADLAEDLRALLGGQPVRARAVTSPLYLLRLFVRRNRALSTTIVLAALFLGLGAAFYIVQLRSANAEISASRDIAEARAADASVATAEATLRIGDTSGAASALRSVPEERRGWTWRHLAQRVGLEADRYPLGATAPYGFHVHADGERAVAYTRERATYLGWDGVGAPVVIAEYSGAILDARLHPDGSVYMIGRGRRELLRWAPGLEFDSSEDFGDEAVEVARLPRRSIKIRFSPDGLTAIVMDGYTRVVGIDVASGEERWSRDLPVPRIDSLEALSGTAFIVGTTGGQVIRGEAGDAPFEQLAMHFGRIRGLLVEGGELLASGGETGQLDLEAALTGHTRVRAKLGQPILSIARVRSDPRLVAVATAAESVALVDVSTGSVTRWLGGIRAEPLGLWSAAAGADDVAGSLASLALDAHFTVHPLGSHDGRLELPPPLGNHYSPVVSATGRWLAVESNGGAVNLYNLSDGARFAVPTGGRETSVEPSLHPEESFALVGRLLVELEPTARVVGEIPLRPPVGDAGERRVSATEWLGGGDLLVASYEGRSSRQDHVRIGLLSAGALDVWRTNLESSSAEVPWTEIELEGGTVRQLLAIPGSADGLCLDSSGHVKRLSGRQLATLWEAEVPGSAVRMTVVESELLVASRDGWVRVLDLATGEPREDRGWKAAQGITRKAALNAITAGPEPGLITTCTVDGRVQVWSVSDGRPAGTVSSGESYLRHVAGVPGKPWVLASGGFGRLVFFGHGTPPITDEGLSAWRGDAYRLEARLADVDAWRAGASQALLGVRARESAALMAKAMDRTFRYRRSDWTAARKRELADAASQTPD
ncbi:MAG: serine/threonine-protein kinase, partial [Planctomycetota bacterium]